MRAATREWVNKAEEDFEVASDLHRYLKKSRYDVVCFLSQQCVEKYLKARLTEADIPFGRTHDLVSLVELLRSLEPIWLAYSQSFATLSRGAVLFRYPGNAATKRQVSAYFRLAKEFRETARTTLGLNAARRKSKIKRRVVRK